MKEFEQLTARMQELRTKAQPALDKADAVFQKIKAFWEKAKAIWEKAKAIWAKAKPWVWESRKLLLAIPVVYLALYFARLNWNVLPQEVGLNLQVTGEYALLISKQLAVYGPLGVTGGCLAMMFLSRKTVYPWMICMFSMLLPLLILVTNIFPA